MMLVCFAACNEANDEDSNDPTKDDSGTPEINPEDYESEYNKALSLIEEGKLEDAHKTLKAIKDYEPAEKMLTRLRYVTTNMSKVEYDDGEQGEKAVYTYTYNENGLPTKGTMEYSYKDMSQTMDIEYFYDANDNLIKITEGGETSYEYTYDENNHLIKEIYVGSNDKTEYFYNENGVLTKKEVTEHGDREVYDYIYDSKGNLIKAVVSEYWGVGPDGKPSEEPHDVSEYEYGYDANGMLIKEPKEYWTHEYTYDSNGILMKEKKVSMHGFGEYVYEYTYDANGNLTKRVATYSGEGRDQEICEYTCDENGNVTKLVAVEGEFKTIFEASYKLVYIPHDICGPVEEIFENMSLENY